MHADLQLTFNPVLNPGVYVYCVAPADLALPAHDIVASFREAEGLTVVLTEEAARRAGLTPVFRAAWITLTVNSQLEDVGLTAAFSKVLAEAGISCNVIAAVHHDHLFVPVERGREALERLSLASSRTRTAP